jgi:serine protease Do
MQGLLTPPVTKMLLVSAAWGIAAIQLPAQPAPPAPAPAPTAPRVLQFTTAGGSYLGIGVQDVDPARSKELKLKEERGVEITAVEEDSPASRAGLRKADVVLEMNGQRVEGVEQFVRMVRETPVGREAKLTVSRDGTVQTLVAKVAQRKGWAFTGDRTMVIPAIPPAAPNAGGGRTPAPPDMPRAYMSWRSGMLGVEAEGLKGALAEFFGVKSGVLVRAVSKGSPAEKGGLKAGDVILKVNDRQVESPPDIAMVLRERGDRKTVTMVIMREKHEMTVSVTFEEEERGSMPPRLRIVRDVRNEHFF